MQEMWVQFLCQEDPTCCGAVPQLISLSSRAQELQLLTPCAATTKAPAPRACALQQEKPVQLESSPHLPQLEKSPCNNEDPAKPKKKRKRNKVKIILYIYAATATAAKSIQSCPILCDPIDGSPPASTIPGILQARTLEWVAISFSNAGK